MWILNIYQSQKYIENMGHNAQNVCWEQWILLLPKIDIFAVKDDIPNVSNPKKGNTNYGMGWGLNCNKIVRAK